MQFILKKTEKMLKLRNYSQKTVKSYVFFAKEYLNFAKKNSFSGKCVAYDRF